MPAPNSPRQKAIRKALRALIPQAPFADFDAIESATRDPAKHNLAPKDVAYLMTMTHIRHQHTDYDSMLEDGYDRDAARHFVQDDMLDVLAKWGSGETIRLNDE